MNDYIVSLVRTGTGLVVGSIIGWLVAKNVLDEADSAQTIANLTAAIVAVVNGLYYAVLRWLEPRTPAWFRPFAAVKQPSY